MSDSVSIRKFIDLSQCLHGAQCHEDDAFAYVGKGLVRWLDLLLASLDVGDGPLVLGKVHPAAFVQGRVYIAAGAIVEPTAYIQGPAYIGPGAEVRHGAYIRGQVYIGPKAVVGHTTEVKGSMFFDGAKAGHFAYVGDAVLGREVNLGAGTKLANLPLRRGIIRVRHPDTQAIVSTGLEKFSAIMGDFAQTGCNAVLSPGTLMLPSATVLPCSHSRGTIGKIS